MVILDITSLANSIKGRAPDRSPPNLKVDDEYRCPVQIPEILSFALARSVMRFQRGDVQGQRCSLNWLRQFGMKYSKGFLKELVSWNKGKSSLSPCWKLLGPYYDRFVACFLSS